MGEKKNSEDYLYVCSLLYMFLFFFLFLFLFVFF